MIRTLQHVPLKSTDVVLDIETGTGAVLAILSRRYPGARMTGIDVSAEMLDRARARLAANAELELATAESLPFAGDRYDAVISTNMFHFIRDPRAALREIGRVLKSGAKLIITDWNKDFLSVRAIDLWLRLCNGAHYHTYGEREMRRLLRAAGFAIAEIDRYRIDRVWDLMTIVATRETDETKPTKTEHPCPLPGGVERDGVA